LGKKLQRDTQKVTSIGDLKDGCGDGRGDKRGRGVIGGLRDERNCWRR